MPDEMTERRWPYDGPEGRARLTGNLGTEEPRAAVATPGDEDMLTPSALRGIHAVDAWLDGAVSDTYVDQPLGQDWARVAKLAEEAGEAISALIDYTGQNPRKGVCGTEAEMLAEIADTATCGMLAIQHFTKDATRTHAILAAALAKVAARAARSALAGDPR